MVDRAFLREISSGVALPPNVSPEAAASAIFDALRRRLNDTESGRFRDAVERLGVDVPTRGSDEEGESFGRNELLRIVAERLGVSTGVAESIARSVFAALRPRLPERVLSEILGQLPNDLKGLILAKVPGLRSPAEQTPPEQPRMDPIARAVEDSGALPIGVDGPTAASAVLCVLARGISRGDAIDLAAELPPGLRSSVHPCVSHRTEPAPELDRAEFVHQVAEHLHATDQQAEDIARVVFAEVKKRMSEAEAKELAAQLPSDLDGFWLEAA